MRTRRMAGFLTALAVLVAAMAVVATPAHACSCMDTSLDEQLDLPESSFIGIAEEVVAMSSDDEQAVVRFSVLEPIKGEAAGDAFGIVRTHDSSCGDAQLIPGGRFFGREAFIQMSGGNVWEACTSIDPSWVDELRPGLDPPERSKPALLLSIGDKRGTQLRLINEDGAVVAYVQDDQLSLDPRDPPGTHAICANGELASVVVNSDNVGVSIRLRNLSTLEYRDMPAGDGATEDSTVRTCTDQGEILLANPDELVLLSDVGELGRFDYGEGKSGSINSSATHFSRFAKFQQIETLAIDDGEVTAIDIRNHTGWRIATSPDGSQHAVLIWSPIDASMTMLVVQNTGETSEIVDSSFSEPVRWLDDSRIAAGSGVYDVETGEVDDSMAAGHFSPTTATESRVLDNVDQALRLYDVTTGENFLIPRNIHWAQTFLPLAQTTEVTSDGFIPPERTAFPVPGNTPPSSLSELEETYSVDGRTFDFLEVSDSNSQSGSATDVVIFDAVDGRTAPVQDSAGRLLWVGIVLAAALGIAGAVWRRRDGDTQPARETDRDL